MSSSTSNKAAALARVQAIIAGTLKHFPSGSFTLGGVAYTTASLVQALTSLVDALTAVATAHASVKDALAALVGIESTVSPLLRAYVLYIRANFAGATQQLADFGLQPPKARAPRTSEQKAAAAAKLRATRKARGTKGKKQKLEVTGDVTGVEIIPVTGSSVAAPPAAAQPAANASSAPTGSTTK